MRLQRARAKNIHVATETVQRTLTDRSFEGDKRTSSSHQVDHSYNLRSRYMRSSGVCGNPQEVGSSAVKGTGESQSEASTWKRQVLTTKSSTRVGVWNVQTMNTTGKLAQVIKEMKSYQLHILGVSEVRWTDSGQITSEDTTVLYSGGSSHVRGVGILLNKQTSKALVSWEPVSDRIITARLATRHTKMTLIQVYAPTNSAPEVEKDDFYGMLQGVLDAVPGHDLKILMGDFNAQIGPDRTGWEDVMGAEALGTRTDNGERLLSCCSVNKLRIGGSIFQHKSIHKGTWRSPDGRTVNQIDHICFPTRWASSLRDVRVYRGADVASDHYLLVASVQLKLKCCTKKKSREIVDVEKLLRSEIRQEFELAIENRFSILDTKENEENAQTSEESVEHTWDVFKDNIMKAAKDTIGFKRGNKKEAWISENTWKAIDERKLLKGKMEQAFQQRIPDNVQVEYRAKDKEVKKRCRADKKKWVEDKLSEAELAAMTGDSKKLYRIVRDLSGSSQRILPIKMANGEASKTHEERSARWKEHFQSVLNCPEPTIAFDQEQSCESSDTQLVVNMNSINEEEVSKAICRLKNGKAAGIDGVSAELLKNGGQTVIERLTKLCNEVWRKQTVPEDWKNGIIIPLPKKGNLTDCNNWRGITLLSIPGKVLATVILERIKDAVDKQLRQEQAGFRKGRSCCDQIFTLRQIMEKVIAGDGCVVINFIDFRNDL